MALKKLKYLIWKNITNLKMPQLHIIFETLSVHMQILVLTNAQPMIPTVQESDSTSAKIGHDGLIISNAEMSRCDSLFNITKANPGDFLNFRNGILWE
jgi:hypothetical protein